MAKTAPSSCCGGQVRLRQTDTHLGWFLLGTTTKKRETINLKRSGGNDRGRDKMNMATHRLEAQPHRGAGQTSPKATAAHHSLQNFTLHRMDRGSTKPAWHANSQEGETSCFPLCAGTENNSWSAQMNAPTAATLKSQRDVEIATMGRAKQGKRTPDVIRPRLHRWEVCTTQPISRTAQDP